MHQCVSCKADLSTDEIALYRKLISRGAREYLCMDCLADDLLIPRKKLEELVEYYHRTGICCLFPQC